MGKVNVQDEMAISRMQDIEDAVDAMVLDSLDPATGRAKGTGITHDWTISSQIAKKSKVRIMLAGGLNSNNVRQDITTVQPWVMDVHSSIETPDGQKNHGPIALFLKEVFSASQNWGFPLAPGFFLDDKKTLDNFLIFCTILSIHF